MLKDKLEFQNYSKIVDGLSESVDDIFAKVVMALPNVPRQMQLDALSLYVINSFKELSNMKNVNFFVIGIKSKKIMDCASNPTEIDVKSNIQPFYLGEPEILDNEHFLDGLLRATNFFDLVVFYNRKDDTCCKVCQDSDEELEDIEFDEEDAKASQKELQDKFFELFGEQLPFGSNAMELPKLLIKLRVLAMFEGKEDEFEAKLKEFKSFMETSKVGKKLKLGQNESKSSESDEEEEVKQTKPKKNLMDNILGKINKDHG